MSKNFLFCVAFCFYASAVLAGKPNVVVDKVQTVSSVSNERLAQLRYSIKQAFQKMGRTNIFDIDSEKTDTAQFNGDYYILGIKLEAVNTSTGESHYDPKIGKSFCDYSAKSNVVIWIKNAKNKKIESARRFKLSGSNYESMDKALASMYENVGNDVSFKSMIEYVFPLFSQISATNQDFGPKGKTLRLNLGSKDGVRKDLGFYVKNGKKGYETIGKLTVKDVYDDYCICSLHKNREAVVAELNAGTTLYALSYLKTETVRTLGSMLGGSVGADLGDPLTDAEKAGL